MGVTGALNVSMGSHFPHDIIFFPLGYEIEIFYNLHIIAA